MSVHGNVRLASIFISQSGEWRLGGFEVLSSMKEDDAVIYVCLFTLLFIFFELTVEDLWKRCS